jgi:hypothetical protein
VLRIAPPMTVIPEEAAEALDILGAALAADLPTPTGRAR